MATIHPFKAVRPSRDKVSLVASRSYDSYTPAERKARLDNNPFSFLHVVNPGYKYAKKVSGVKRFELVRQRYEEFCEEAVLIKEDQPSFYVYKIIDREGQEFCGLVAAAAVEDYQNGVIKKHEHTLRLREELFKEYLKTVGFNAEAVLLTYPDESALEQLLQQLMEERPEYEFTTTYRDTHYLWPVQDSSTIKRIQQVFENMAALYIADGHHRSQSSFLLAEDLKAANKTHTGTEAYNYFMAYLLPESQLKIYEFNRLVKDLNGLSKEEFLVALDTNFRIQNRGKMEYKPSKKHHFSMYLDGEFYSLYLRKRMRRFDNALQGLDAQILFEYILQPILGIKDARKDERLAYAHGKKGFAFLTDKIDKKQFAVGFGMLPVTMEEMKQIADQDLRMPPKSTYIEPKLRSAVTIYEFE
ncbi:DUF1015 domain-containing protein [Croceiramulus getboli]|nr:DUF1015 domain-containing protein [Flavobacteriaceae bacterium YJPT1-3]